MNKHKKLITAAILSISMMLSFLFLLKLKRTPFDYIPILAPNACLVDAISFGHAYKVSQRMSFATQWSVILCYTWDTIVGTQEGHAVCLFLYKDKYYVYDPSFGSWTLLGDDLDKLDLYPVLTRTVPAGATNLEIKGLIYPK